MAYSTIISPIENIVLKWNETKAENGDFGARAFLYRGNEFGHIHQNADLDITFGEQITAQLLQKGLVQKHLYVPSSNITYQVTSNEKLIFGISLLRFSYLTTYLRVNVKDPDAHHLFKKELAKLPESLSSVDWSGK